MIITCPNCKTKYNLPDAKIPAGGAKVKCSKCAHVFQAKPPKLEPEDQALDLLERPEAQAPAGSSQAFEDAFDEAVSDARKPAPKPASKPRPEPEPEPEPEEDEADTPYGEEAPAEEETPAEDEAVEEEPVEDEAPAEEEEAAEPEDEGPHLDGDLTLDGGPAKKPAKRKKPLLLALLLCVLALVLVYVTYVLQPVLPFNLPALPFNLPGVKAPASEQDAESPAARVKKIALRNMRQYVVVNEKTGPVFVIEGKAVNTFDSPKEHIRVEAALYDANGNVLGSKQMLCGNTLSQLQLQVQTEEEINTGLTSEVGVLSNNTFLKPGMDTPFMIVFFNPPKNIKEFGVKVIDARDPAQ